MTIKGSIRKGDNPFTPFFRPLKKLNSHSNQFTGYRKSDSEDIYAIIYSQMPIEDEIHGQIPSICSNISDVTFTNSH